MSPLFAGRKAFCKQDNKTSLHLDILFFLGYTSFVHTKLREKRGFEKREEGKSYDEPMARTE
jgi:hypothetical protein